MNDSLTFGNFTVETDVQGAPLVLGEGAFGRTFKTRQRYLNIPAAVKVIHDRWIYDQSQKDAFLREAKIAAGLDHPNIARVLDFGESDGRLYLALEYCDGGSLEDLVSKRGPLQPAQVAFVALQTLQALSFAHASDVLHRDIKPSNLLIGKASGAIAVKLIDFGLAVLTDHAPNPAEQGKFRGTPLFAAPEQIRDEPLDPRSDLFSLGMSLWWLLLGHSPEPANAAEVIGSRLSTTSYEHKLPQLPAQLGPFLAALLNKNRDERPADANAALDLLTQSAGDLLDHSAGLNLEESRDDAPPSLFTTDSPPPAAQPESLTQSLHDLFSLGDAIDVRQEGSIYLARQKSDGAKVRLWLSSQAMEDSIGARELLDSHVALLKQGILAFPPVSQYLQSVEGLSVVFPPEPGSSMQHIVRENGPVKLEPYKGFLRKMLEGLQASRAAGLPDPSLDPRLVYFVEEDQLSDGQIFTPRFLNLSADYGKTWGYSTTVTAMPMNESTLSMTSRFCALLYFFLAGRPLPEAAYVSPSAYVPTPLLSERTNRLLAGSVANSTAAAGVDEAFETLEAILAAEGVLRGEAGSASRASSSGYLSSAYRKSSPGDSSATPSALPKQTTNSRQEQDPAQTPGDSPQSATLSPPAGDAAVETSSTAKSPSAPRDVPVEAASHTVTQQRGINWTWPVLAAGLALLLVLAAALSVYFLFFAQPDGEDVRSATQANGPAQSPENDQGSSSNRVLSSAQHDDQQNIRLALDNGLIGEAQRLVERYKALYGSGDFTAEIEQRLKEATSGDNQELQVPGDASTLTAALEKAKPGQVIVLAAGTYAENVRLKPGVNIRGSEGGEIVISGSGDGAILSLVQAGRVDLENLLLEPAGSAGIAILVDSGEVNLDNVRLGKRSEVGIRAQSKSRVVLENCLVSAAVSNGIELATSSHLTMRNTRVTGNGKSGIYAQPTLTTLLLEAGNVIENNGRSGIEVEGGGSLRMINGELRGNGDAGLVAAGQGTTVRLEGVRAIGNQDMGISLLNKSSGFFKNLVVQDNHAEGLMLSDAQAAEISGCTITGNGSLGIFLQGASETIVIKENQILDHPQIGLAVTNAQTTVTGNTFANNALAMLFSTGAQGQATGNTVRRLENQETILQEDTASVQEENNTITASR